MDLASAISHINNEALNINILEGYKSISKYKPDMIGIDICLCFQILLFVICQHNKFAKEQWFQEALDKWCDNNFIPLCIKLRG